MVPIALSSAPRHMKGINPSLGVLKTVRETVTIPVHPIIRPRGGDFATPRASLRRCSMMW